MQPTDTRASSAIRWLRPRDEADRVALGPWSATVGPPVVEMTGAGTANGVDTLVVVTWNIHVGGGDLIRFVGDLRSGRLTGEPVEDFVLLLQEAHRSGEALPPLVAPGRVARRIAPRARDHGRLDIVAAARRLGLDLVYAPSMRNGGRGSEPEDRGNAVLASVPLSSPTAIELPYEAQRRVSVGARVAGTASDGSGWELDVVSVHLDNRSRWSRAFASAGAGRLRQARGLVDALCPHRPTVVGGDLNTWASRSLEGALSLLEERFPDTPACRAEPTFTLGRVLTRRLDHLFFRLTAYQAASVGRADSRYGSDHYPLVGAVRFGAAPALPAAV